MNWKFKLVRARHKLVLTAEDGERFEFIGYEDPETKIKTALTIDKITPSHVLELEEFSTGNEGVIYLDINSGKFGMMVKENNETVS